MTSAVKDMKCVKLELDDSFFEEEIRCEYTITKDTKKIWAVQLDLLAELLRVCNKYNISVSAYAGTILGAVRHKGFIPWDDDIDVCLNRENYELLLSHADEFKHPYFLQTCDNDREFFIGYARLRNSLTTAIVSWEKSENYNSGIFIDIFVLDGFVEDENKLIKQLRQRDKIVRNIGLFHWNQATGIKRIAKRIAKAVLCIGKTYDDLLIEYKKCISMYSSDVERVTLMTHVEGMLKKYWCNKLELENLVEVAFESIMIPIPRNYDAILKNMYGNYMEFPAMDKRGKWHEDIISFNPDIPYKEYYRINGSPSERKK